MSIAMEKVEVLAGDTVHAAAASGAGGGWFAQRAKPPGVYQLRILGRHAFYLPKTIRWDKQDFGAGVGSTIVCA